MNAFLRLATRGPLALLSKDHSFSPRHAERTQGYLVIAKGTEPALGLASAFLQFLMQTDVLSLKIGTVAAVAARISRPIQVAGVNYFYTPLLSMSASEPRSCSADRPSWAR